MRQLGKDRISRSSVLAGVKSVDDKGLTREITFQANGEPVDSTEFVYQVRSQKIALLGKISDLIK